MIVVAHAGHWLLNLVYAFPILLVIGFIAIDKVRQRNEEDDPPEPE